MQDPTNPGQYYFNKNLMVRPKVISIEGHLTYDNKAGYQSKSGSFEVLDTRNLMEQEVYLKVQDFDKQGLECAVMWRGATADEFDIDLTVGNEGPCCGFEMSQFYSIRYFQKHVAGNIPSLNVTGSMGRE